MTISRLIRRVGGSPGADHDMLVGPCCCGAWHLIEGDRFVYVVDRHTHQIIQTHSGKPLNGGGLINLSKKLAKGYAPHVLLVDKPTRNGTRKASGGGDG